MNKRGSMIAQIMEGTHKKQAQLSETMCFGLSFSHDSDHRNMDWPGWSSRKSGRLLGRRRMYLGQPLHGGKVLPIHESNHE